MNTARNTDPMPPTLLQSWDRCALHWHFSGRDVLHKLAEKYNAPQRHYHNLHHVVFCLEHWWQHNIPENDWCTGAMALMWHDAIYDPTQNDNEARSAQLARHDLHYLGLHADAISSICTLILHTQHGKLPAQALPAYALPVLDIDLLILGSEWSNYLQYALQIRSEYAHVPLDAFIAGRSQVLQHFLNLTEIYHSPPYQLSHSKQARINLAREMREASNIYTV